MAVILNHQWNTYKNKAINKSVTACAPKREIFSLPMSIDTRVSIARGIYVLGYATFQKRFFPLLNLNMDDNLLDGPVQSDRSKENRVLNQRQRKERK